MNAIIQEYQFETDSPQQLTSSQSATPDVLTDIYKDTCHIAVWQRDLPSDFMQNLSDDLQRAPLANKSFEVSADAIEHDIAGIAHDRVYGEQLREYIAQYIDMFCVLFDTDKVGLRLSSLDKAMCPKFHVNWVPCRLVTTFCGVGTQWLANDSVDRTKLGHGSQGLPDEQSGLFATTEAIQQLKAGDVALLKGDAWEDNEGAGLVHRSPALKQGEIRLLLTLDLL